MLGLKKVTSPFSLGWLCLYALLFSASLNAQESPQRFLQATQWIARITRDVSDSGSAPADDCTWSWNVNSSVNIQVRMIRMHGPNVNSWDGVETQNYTANGHENFDEICPTGAAVVSRGEMTAAKPAPNVFLYIDPDAGTYSLGLSVLDVPFSGTITYSGAFTIPQPTSIPFWSGDTSGKIDRPLPSTGMVLSGEITYPLTKPPLIHVSTGVQFPYVNGVGGGNIILRWDVRPEVQPLELVVDIENYQDWIPEGNFDDPKLAGNLLDVKATVQGTNGAPTQAKAKWIKFEMLDVSREPGVCLNMPNRAAAKTDPDLQFEAALNPFPMLRTSESVIETLPGEYASANATISSFDFGGWCRLKVTAEVQGQILTGYLRSNTARDLPEIPIPRRQLESHIADPWLEADGVIGKSNTDDSENDPVGDGHRGDGYTLYEEYRGFCQNGSILRTSGTKKDLMLLNGIGGPGAAAARRFHSASKIEVHDEFQSDEFSSNASSPEDCWLNFNHGSDHVVDQHGLRIVENNSTDAVASANNRTGFAKNSTPGSKSEIETPHFFNLLAVEDFSGTIGNAGYAASSYAHEIAHGCSVYHHGEGDPDVTWRATSGVSGLDWTENGAAIFAFNENGGSYINTVGKNIQVSLGTLHGLHSGDDRCFMRYDVARAYASPAGSSTRYHVASEPVGTTLCKAPEGTGVNATGRNPRPRYGDAAAGRGKCLSQLCVNDLYVSDASHNR